jgi:hypothetical protein
MGARVIEISRRVEHLVHQLKQAAVSKAQPQFVGSIQLRCAPAHFFKGGMHGAGIHVGNVIHGLTRGLKHQPRQINHGGVRHPPQIQRPAGSVAHLDQVPNISSQITYMGKGALLQTVTMYGQTLTRSGRLNEAR